MCVCIDKQNNRKVPTEVSLINTHRHTHININIRDEKKFLLRHYLHLNTWIKKIYLVLVSENFRAIISKYCQNYVGNDKNAYEHKHMWTQTHTHTLIKGMKTKKKKRHKPAWHTSLYVFKFSQYPTFVLQ